MARETLFRRTARLYLVAAATCLVGGGVLSSPAAESSVLELTGETMGSYYYVKLVDCAWPLERLDKLKEEIDERLQQINRQLSHYLPESELSRFGQSPAHQPFPISSDFAQVLRLALDLHQKSKGLFDPTLGPLIDLWGFGPKGQRQEPPSPAEIEAARKKVGARHIKLTEHNELIKDIPELQLNLGSITKGYATREMARILLGHSLTNFYAAISGEVYVHGRGPAGPDWRIGIDEPIFGAQRGEKVKVVVRLTNSAISTSGNYRKYFRTGTNQVYAHIIDPTTGYPTTHSLASVTVICPDSEVADGLATAAFALGPERGLQFIEESTHAAALFIVRNADGSFRRFASKRFPKFEVSAGN